MLPADPGARPVTITIDAGHPGPVVPADFAGLSFERGPLNPGNAGVKGHLFSPAKSAGTTGPGCPASIVIVTGRAPGSAGSIS